MIKILMTLMLIGSCGVVYSSQDETTMPSNCHILSQQTAEVKLTSKKSSMVVFYNHSALDLWLIHPVKEGTMGAGWTSRLQPGNFTALALQDKEFIIQCISSKPGHEQHVPCLGVTNICQWADVTYPKNSEQGTYWAAENKKLTPLMQDLQKRGFEFPTH